MLKLFVITLKKKGAERALKCPGGEITSIPCHNRSIMHPTFTLPVLIREIVVEENTRIEKIITCKLLLLMNPIYPFVHAKTAGIPVCCNN